MTGAANKNGRQTERGLALLVVLWGVATAALLVSAFNVSVRSGANFVTAEMELTKAEALADAGLEIAVAHLIDEDAGRRWLADGTAHRLDFGEAALTITIDDPNGLVDVNRAGKELLLSFLTWATDSTDKAELLLQQLLFLRDATSKKTNETAERGGNSNAPETAAPPTPGLTQLGILDVTELRRIEGMTPDLYRSIAPYLTIYGRDGRINPYGAPRAVLAALPGLTEIDIDRFFDGERNDREALKNSLPKSLAKANSFLSRETGPAYIVSVLVAKPGRPVLVARQFVLAIGLDPTAPYRLLVTKPFDLNSASER